MTFLVLQSAATGARIVAARLCRRNRQTTLRNHFGRRTPLPQESSHPLHGLIDVRKERSVTRTEIVQPGFTRGGLYETVLWTFPVARKTDWTFTTVARERVALVQSELTLRV